MYFESWYIDVGKFLRLYFIEFLLICLNLICYKEFWFFIKFEF